MSRNNPPTPPKNPLIAALREHLTRIVPWKPKYAHEAPTWETDQKNRRSQLRAEFDGYTLAQIDEAISEQYEYMLKANREADRAKDLYHDMLAIKRGF